MLWDYYDKAAKASLTSRDFILITLYVQRSELSNEYCTHCDLCWIQSNLYVIMNYWHTATLIFCVWQRQNTPCTLLTHFQNEFIFLNVVPLRGKVREERECTSRWGYSSLMPQLGKNVVKMYCLMHTSVWKQTCSFETWKVRDLVAMLKDSVKSEKSSILCRICIAGWVLTWRPQTLHTECLNCKIKLFARKWDFQMLTWIKKEGLKEILIPKGWGNWILCPLSQEREMKEWTTNRSMNLACTLYVVWRIGTSIVNPRL